MPSLFWDDVMTAHHALHNGDSSATLSDGEKVFIIKSNNGCRSVKVKGVTFMEQNKTKSSNYAAMARAGKRVTWIIAEPKWGLIIDNDLAQACSIQFIYKSNSSSNSISSNSNSNTNNNLKTPPKNLDKEEKNLISTLETKKRLINDDNDEDLEAKKQKLDTRVFNLSIKFMEYWCTPLNKTMKIPLFPVDEEYRRVEQMFKSTISPSHKNRYGYFSFKITKLERFQSPDQWSIYYLRKNEILRANEENPARISGVLTTLLDIKVNEYYFFHGLNEKVADIITESGFDERVSSLNGMFGCGIYFAENSSKSDIYAHSATCKQVGAVYQGQQNLCTCCNDFTAEKVMLLCRVCVGTPSVMLEPTDKDNPLRRPPNQPNGKPYDSVLGESKKWNPKASVEFREFIIYDRRQCYPEYIIHYSRI